MTVSPVRAPIVVAALLAVAGAAFGQPAAPAAPGAAPASAARVDVKTLARDPAFQKRLQAWRALPPEEKERLRTRQREWKEKPEPERGRLAATLVRFQSLSPAEQGRLRAAIARLTPEQREKLQQAAARFRGFVRQHQIPAGAFVQWMKRVPRAEIERIRALPADERRAAVQEVVRRFQQHVVERVESEIPEAEREAYRALPFPEKLARARRWFSERAGRREHEGTEDRSHPGPPGKERRRLPPAAGGDSSGAPADPPPPDDRPGGRARNGQ